MRKSALYLAVITLFAGMALAQASGDQGTAGKMSKDSGKAKTEHQVTGCLSGPDADRQRHRRHPQRHLAGDRSEVQSGGGTFHSGESEPGDQSR